MRPAVSLILLAFLLCIPACQIGRYSSLDPSSDWTSAYGDLTGLSLHGDWPRKLDDYGQALVDSGKVDTIYAENYRVDQLPEAVPEGFRALTATFRKPPQDQVVQYNYILPDRCGVYHVIIFEWGTSGGYTRCADSSSGAGG